MYGMRQQPTRRCTRNVLKLLLRRESDFRPGSFTVMPLTIRRLCDAVRANQLERPTKFVLMNTTENSNRGLAEPISFAQTCVAYFGR